MTSHHSIPSTPAAGVAALFAQQRDKKGIKIDVPLYLDVTMRCYVGSQLTAGGRYTHSDGTVMAFLKQLWKTKRLILCKKINIILSQTPAFHEFFTNMKVKTNCFNLLGPNNNVYVCGTVQWLELFENVPSTRHQISNNSKSGHNM